MDNEQNRRADDKRAPGQLQWGESGEAAAPAAERFSYTITPRAPHVGGGWRLQLLEDGQEVGGGIYPVTEEVTSDDAHQEAMDDGEAWLRSRGDGAAAEPNSWAGFIKGCGYDEVAPGRFQKPVAAPASADNPSTDEIDRIADAFKVQADTDVDVELRAGGPKRLIAFDYFKRGALFASKPVAADNPSTACADEPLCPACQGSGEGVCMEGAGPDAYEVPCNCQHCGGSGGLLDAYNHLVGLLSAEREKYLNLCHKVSFAAPVAQSTAGASEQIAKVIMRLIGEGAMDWRATLADEAGHEDGFNSDAEELNVLAEMVRKALAAPALNPSDVRNAALEEAAELAIKLTAVPRDVLGPPTVPMKARAYAGGCIADSIRALKTASAQGEKGGDDAAE